MTRTPLLLALPLIGFTGTAAPQDLDRFLDAETLELAETYDKRLRYTPSTVVILDRAYIANSGALIVAELLERVVGIHMTRKPYGASSNQFIRGIDSNLLILHNGVENAKLIPELLAMPVIDLERVEVVKGSHYPLYRASAVVGTINLVTSGVAEDVTDVGTRVGSQDTRQVWVRRSDRLDNVGYSAYFSHTSTRTTDGEIRADLQTFIDQGSNAAVSLAPRDGFFDAEISDARVTLEFGERWTLHQFLNHREFGTGVGLSQSLDPKGQEVVTYYSADLRFEDRIGNGDFEARLTYNRLDLDYNDLTILLPGGVGPLLPDGAIQRRYSKVGDDLFVEGLYRVVADRNTLDIGLGGSVGRIDNVSDVRNYDLVPQSRLPAPLGDFLELVETRPLFGDDYDYERAHVMLRNEYALTNNLFVNAGGRVDYLSRFGTFLIPRIGLDWAAGQFTNVSLLYGESVQPPDEVTQTSQGLYFAQGDDDLDPERIRLLELAIDHRFSRSLAIVANLYAFNLRDTIAIVDNPAAPNETSYANLPSLGKGTGAEIVLEWNVSSGATLSTGFSAVRVDSDDLSVQTSPRFEPFAELNLVSRNGLNTNIAAIGVFDRDRRVGDTRAPIDDYTIINATLTKSNVLLRGLDVSLSVQNVFDADAREDIAPLIPFDLPVYPRRALVGVSYRHR